MNSNDSCEDKIENSLINTSNCGNILGIKIDTKSTFDDHIKEQHR